MSSKIKDLQDDLIFERTHNMELAKNSSYAVKDLKLELKSKIDELKVFSNLLDTANLELKLRTAD